MANSQISVIGAGSLGHLWQCYLQRNGADSRIYSSSKSGHQSIEVVAPGIAFSESVDYYPLDQLATTSAMLICVKAFQLESLCQQLALLSLPSTPVLLMMNGMGLVEIVSNCLPGFPVVQCSVTHGAWLHQATLNYTGTGEISAGNLGTEYPQALFTPTLEALDAALPSASWNHDHQRRMWQKLMVNAVINPVTAINDIRNGELVSHNQLIPPAEALLQELAPLLPEYLPGTSLEQLRQMVIQVARDTASNRSSMLQDLAQGKKTEIDFINGYLLAKANQRGILLAQHERISQKIKQRSIE